MIGLTFNSICICIPMPLPDSFIREALKRNSDVAWIPLAEIFYSEQAAPFRIAASYEDITHNGNVFQASDFTVTLPSEEEAEEQTIEWQMSATDRRIVTLLRTYQQEMRVTLKHVLSSDHNVAGMKYELILLEVNYTRTVISGILGADPLYDLPACSGTFNTADFPGLT